MNTMSLQTISGSQGVEILADYFQRASSVVKARF